MKCWEDQVLIPKLPVEPTKEQLTLFEKKKEVSKYFGGQPQISGGEEQIKRETPKLKSPPKVTVTKKRKKIFREGC